MVRMSKMSNVVVFGAGVLLISSLAMKLMRKREQRLAMLAERNATKSWEGEGGSVMGVSPPIFEPSTR